MSTLNNNNNQKNKDIKTNNQGSGIDEAIENVKRRSGELDVNDESQYYRSRSSDIDYTRVFMNNTGSHRILTREEEYELARRVREGDQEAKDTLILHNMRLVFNVAGEVNQNTAQLNSVGFDDLVQEGVIGLMTAADKYDPDKYNTRFSTYAVWWIKHKMYRFINNNGRVIRIPVHMNNLIYKLGQILSEYEEAGEDYPTVEELAFMLDTSEQNIILAIRNRNHTLSTNYPLTDETGNTTDTLEALIEKDLSSYEDPVNNAFESELHDILLNTLKDNLDERSYGIMILRFGLLGNERHTLAEVGEKFDLTRERIRQIEKRSLRILKRVDKKNGGFLKVFLDE